MKWANYSPEQSVKKELLINLPTLDSQRPEVDEHEAGGRDAGVGEDEVGELGVSHGPHLDPHAVVEQVVDVLDGKTEDVFYVLHFKSI